MPTPNQSSSPTPDVFDSLSPGQSSAATPSQGATQAPVQNDAFDQAADSSASGQTSSSTLSVPDALHIDQNDSLPLKTAKGINAFGAGIGDGVLNTLNGGADLLHLPHATLEQRQKELEQQNSENPVSNKVGYGSETLMEFLTGDEALKGLALSDKLLKSAKIAKALEGSPRLMQALHVGADALRGGAVQGTLGTVRSGGNLKTGAEEGAAAAGLTGALGAVPVAVKAIRGALDVQGIQKPLQDSLRGVLSDVASHMNLNAPTSQSIRDVVQDVQQQVKAQGSNVYQQLDQISGGQAQRFRDAAENVSQKLKEITGLDDEKEAELVAKQKQIDTAHKVMLDKLEAAGHPRDLLTRADALWQKQGALTDLSNSLRQSVSGMRPELAGANASAESVNPKTLFVKLNRLHDSGRLTQAIGPGNAEAILQAVDAAYARSQAIAANNKWAGYLTKAAASAGLGGLGYEGVKMAHGLLGSAQ